MFSFVAMFLILMLPGFCFLLCSLIVTFLEGSNPTIETEELPVL